MITNNKSIYFLFGILFTLLLVNLVSAADTSILSNIGSYVHDLTNGIPDDSKGGIAKILLVALVVIFVYSILEFIPLFSEKTGLQWAVAVIVGLLSFLFVSYDNIKFILANYEALGIALTTIIPLIILIAFTLNMQMDKRYGMWKTFINKFFIVLYIVYVLYAWLTISWDDSNPTPALAWVYPLSLIIALIWFFAFRPVARVARRAKDKEEQEGVRDINTNATANIIDNSVQNKIKIIMAKFDKDGHISVRDQRYLKAHGAGHLMFGKDVSP